MRQQTDKQTNRQTNLEADLGILAGEPFLLHKNGLCQVT